MHSRAASPPKACSRIMAAYVRVGAGNAYSQMAERNSTTTMPLLNARKPGKIFLSVSLIMGWNSGNSIFQRRIGQPAPARTRGKLPVHDHWGSRTSTQTDGSVEFAPLRTVICAAEKLRYSREFRPADVSKTLWKSRLGVPRIDPFCVSAAKRAPSHCGL